MKNDGNYCALCLANIAERFQLYRLNLLFAVFKSLAITSLGLWYLNL